MNKLKRGSLALAVLLSISIASCGINIDSINISGWDSESSSSINLSEADSQWSSSFFESLDSYFGSDTAEQSSESSDIWENSSNSNSTSDSSEGDEVGGEEVPDGAQTLQLLVSDFGYGVDWAYAMVDAFKQEAWVQEKYPNLTIPEPTITTIRTKPVSDIESTYATHDLYFSCDYAIKPLGESDGVRFYADLTDMYNTTIPGESVTVKDKMYAQFVEQADRDLGAGFNAMDFPWVNGSYGLLYNQYVVDTYLGKDYAMPVTTYELVQMGNHLKANKKNPRLIMVAKKQPGWTEGAFRVMWGQYGGQENFRNFMEGKVNGQYSPEIFKDTARLRSMEAIEELLWYTHGYVNTDYADKDYVTTQVHYLNAEACFMYMGDWFELEMAFMNDPENADFINPNNEFHFLKTPIISSIVERMDLYTHGTKEYSTLSDAEKAAYNTQLSAIVKAVDEGKTALDGVSKKDLAIVQEARMCKSTLGGHVAFIPENSDAKDLAKDFLIFMASDKGIETFMKATNGVSTAFKYQMDYNSDLFKGFSPLQQQRIKDTSVNDWHVGRGYATPLTRSGVLSDICVQYGQKQLEIEFCSQGSKDRRTAQQIVDALYALVVANDNRIWKAMLERAGITS